MPNQTAMAGSTEVLGGIDITVLTVYFGVFIATSLYAMCTSKRDTPTGYFLAGRYMSFLPIGASLFASNIGSQHFIGLAGSGAASGIGVAAYELDAIFFIQMLGWVFLPVYLTSAVNTLPQYIQKRYGGQRIQIYLSLLSLVIYIVTKMSVNLYTGSLFIKAALHWDFVYAVLLLLAITSFCTITGGLAAVIYTDTIQAILMCTGGLTLMGFSFHAVGGFSQLFSKYMEARPSSMTENTTCALPRDDALYMLRAPIGSDIPWVGLIFGQSVVSLWYWCTDQVIVQRALAAKNLSHGQGGTLLAGYLKILPLFVMVLPGMVSRILYTDEIACATPEACEEICNNRAGCSNLAYPLLIMGLMPTGLKGLLVAVMLAALITDLTSIFNSASTLFTMDIYPLFRKVPSNREQMVVGRFFIVVMIVCSIFWVSVIENTQGGQLYVYIQAIQSYLGPPIAAIFVTGALWARANEKGAFWALVAGLITGGTRTLLEFAIFPSPGCGEPDNRPAFVANVHYMYFSIILFVQSVLVIVIVSLMTTPLESWYPVRTVFSRRFDDSVRPDELKELEITSLRAKNFRTRRDENNSEIEHIRLRNPNGTMDYSKQETEPTIISAPFSRKWLNAILNWFCGFSVSGENEHAKTEISLPNYFENDQNTVEAEMKTIIHNRLSAVQQKRSVHLILAVNTAVLLAVPIFMFIYFSVPNSLNS